MIARLRGFFEDPLALYHCPWARQFFRRTRYIAEAKLSSHGQELNAPPVGLANTARALTATGANGMATGTAFTCSDLGKL